MGITATAAILPNSLPQPPDRPETIHGVAISSNAERLSLISLRYYGVRPAFDACMEQSQGTAPAQQDCADAELTYQDDRLNRAYKALLADLDDLDKRAAMQAQRAWLAFRDKDCGARAGRFDVPPLLSSTAVWSPIPQLMEIGREEALFRRTDHRLPA